MLSYVWSCVWSHPGDVDRSKGLLSVGAKPHGLVSLLIPASRYQQQSNLGSQERQVPLLLAEIPKLVQPQRLQQHVSSVPVQFLFPSSSIPF